MKKTLVLSAAVAGVVMTSSLAWAQDDTPTCEEATTVVVDLEVEVRDLAARELVAEQDELAGAQDALPALQRAVDDAIAADNEAGLTEDSEATTEAKAALAVGQQRVTDAEVALATDSDELAGLRARLQVAVTERDNVCDEPTPEPSTTPPTAEPTRDVFNCADFSTRADAQAKFNEDVSDPHNLDADGNGRACERHFDENLGVDVEGDFDQVGELPSSIDTGRA